MPQTGDTLGNKYLLTRLIGKGGMGMVFEAKHLELDKKVAIKVPTEELTKAKKDLERFKREPRAAAATGHPSIIDIYDIGLCDDNVPFVVMELLDGESLSEFLARKGCLDVSLAVYIIECVLSALAAAHEKKVIHRDLKPDNVFLVETGQLLPEVKILDFGTSIVTGGGITLERLTENGALVGTPHYMAPEQIDEELELDHRVDIYASGVLLYEMLTGKLPFRGDNIFTLVHKVMEGEFQAPGEIRDEIPDQLEAIIMRALSHNPNDRFSSAATMFQALVPYLDKTSRGRISVPECLGKSVFLSECEGTVERTTTETDSSEQDFTTAPTLLSEVPKRRRRGTGGLIAVTATLIAIVAISVGLLISKQETRSTVAEFPDSAPEEPVAPIQPALEKLHLASDAAAPTAQDPTEQLVTLSLENVPQNATVLLDGARIPGNELRLRPSPVAQRLVVRVEGRQVLQELITIDDNMMIDVGALVAGTKHPRKRRRIPQAITESAEQATAHEEADPRPTKIQTDFVEPGRFRPSDSKVPRISEETGQ